MIVRRWYSSIIHVRSFREVDCDTDHHLPVAKFKERLAVSNQAAQKYDRERFNFKKLNELDIRKQFQIDITNRFAVLENFSDSEDINRAWENTPENIKTSAKDTLGLYKLQHHKRWFDKECLCSSDQWKQAKMMWLQAPNQSSVHNLNNVKCDARRHFRNT